MAIHHMTGKVGEGKSVEAHIARISYELTQLDGKFVCVSFHTGERGLYISVNGILKKAPTGGFNVTVVHHDAGNRCESACVSFGPERVSVVKQMAYGPVINLS